MANLFDIVCVIAWFATVLYVLWRIARGIGKLVRWIRKDKD